jgi:anthranilate synthase component 2
MKILLIDNYDSFTYNLSLLVKLHTGVLPEVRRNDGITLEEVAFYDKIILSPGPVFLLQPEY